MKKLFAILTIICGLHTAVFSASKYFMTMSGAGKTVLCEDNHFDNLVVLFLLSADRTVINAEKHVFVYEVREGDNHCFMITTPVGTMIQWVTPKGVVYFSNIGLSAKDRGWETDDN